MRRVAMILAVACVFLTCSAARASSADGTWSKTWTVTGPNTGLRVDADFGDIHVVQGTANSVHAEVTTYRWRIEPNEVQVTGTQEGNHIELRIETPHYHGGGIFHWSTPKLYVELQVPSGANLDLHTGFGDISGDNLSATARADTGFGKIRFPGFTGDLTGDTGFGDIRIDGRFEKLRVKTGFGDIHAEVNNGSKMRDDWRLETGFGSVQVRVPADLNADLDAQSGFGHVSTDIPLTVSDTTSHSSVRGRLGNGGMALELETGFGSVHIGRT